jgi:lysophospholipase
MGSWDPTLFGMAPLKYVGSNFQNGKISGDECVTGFDNAAFIMSTSSTLFNVVVAKLLETHKNGILATVTNWIHDLAERLDRQEDDIASWSPNPFRGWNPSLNKGANSRVLGLVDGGEDYQNIPLNPLIQPVRKVDVIFAVDSSADSGNLDGWPNGTALIATYERHLSPDIANGTVFPAIPDVNTFTNLGLNSQPTFFGCDAKNISGPSPLLVYIPNHPYTFYTNISTGTTTLKNKERNAIIRNGYHVATMGNGTVEPEWPACVGCAILSRSFDRTGTTPPQMCQDCFKKHCWNGTLDSRKPGKFTPKLALPQDADSNKTKGKSDGKGDESKKKSAAVHVQLEGSVLLGMFMVAIFMLSQ